MLVSVTYGPVWCICNEALQVMHVNSADVLLYYMNLEGWLCYMKHPLAYVFSANYALLMQLASIFCVIHDFVIILWHHTLFILFICTRQIGRAHV